MEAWTKRNEDNVGVGKNALGLWKESEDGKLKEAMGWDCWWKTEIRWQDERQEPAEGEKDKVLRDQEGEG